MPCSLPGARGMAEAAACTRQAKRRSARATHRSMPNELSARPALMRAPPLRPARCCRLHAWPDTRVCARYATHVQLRLKPGALQGWLGSARCCGSAPQRNPVIPVRAAFSLLPDAYELHLQERAPQQACCPKPWQGQTGTCSGTAAGAGEACSCNKSAQSLQAFASWLTAAAPAAGWGSANAARGARGRAGGGVWQQHRAGEGVPAPDRAANRGRRAAAGGAAAGAV